MRTRLVLLFVAGCTGAGEPSPYEDAHLHVEGHDGGRGTVTGVAQPLFDIDALEPLAAERDPLRMHRPETVICGQPGAYVEDGHFEINTAYCNYAAFAAPALIDVTRDDAVTLALNYYDLTAPEPAETHIALYAADVLLFETHIPIPGRADVLEATWTLDQDIPKGTPVSFHLHNHGQNTYRLTKVSVSR